jgi:hypothetical protein
MNPIAKSALVEYFYSVSDKWNRERAVFEPMLFAFGTPD